MPRRNPPRHETLLPMRVGDPKPLDGRCNCLFGGGGFDRP